MNSDFASSIVNSWFDILRERLFVKAIFSKSVVRSCTRINRVLVRSFNEKMIAVELTKLYVL